MRRIEAWIPAETAAAVLVALATTLMLQSVRVFVSYLVFVIDQSQRTTIAIIAIAVFAFPILTWLFTRFSTAAQVLTAAVFALALGRLVVQLVEQPVTRLAASAVAVAAWGVLLVLVVVTYRRAAATGLITGLALDLAIRTARGSLDLPWMPGWFQTLVATVMIAGLIGIAVTSRLEPGAGCDWRSASALVVIGPAIALFHLVTGNPAFVSTHTGLSAGASSALLAGGMAFGVVIAVLRLLALSLGAGGGPMAGRFILFDAAIGGIALSFAWNGDGLAPLGVFFATVTVTEMTLFALAAGNGTSARSLLPAATLTTSGLLLQFAALFLYYTDTGSGMMLAIIWISLVGGTLISALSLSAALRGAALNLRRYAIPVAATGVLLAVSIGWTLATSNTPQARESDDDALTAITYNIQSGFSRDNRWDLNATAEVIEDSGADIVFLQEVSRGWLVTTGNDEMAWLSRTLDLPYAWGPASTDDLWGNAILSRYPILSERVVKYDSTQNLRRSALIVELDAGDGRVVTAIATHLDNPDEASDARAEQVEQLADLIDLNQTTILAGDFNMAPDDPLIQSLVAAGLIDAAEAGGAPETTSENGRRIDYIFVTEDIGVESASVINSDASDHKPVVVTLELP